MTVSVTIEGLDVLERQFASFPAEAARATEAGLLAAAVIVEADAKRRVHSDSNPWSGSRNPYYRPPTGKLQSTISTGRVEGSGINKQVSIGLVSRGGSFGRSYRTKSGKTGSYRNSGDVQVYGPLEERRHPFLGPALHDNLSAISRAFWQRFDVALGVFRRAA